MCSGLTAQSPDYEKECFVLFRVLHHEYFGIK